ncbi:hypothetical protein BSKO_11830 [Bryopsis sp. KO-2023]|nr:hypothetical protein BSKO_11830 [Bryopsis sp. KO-2023]
MEGDLKDLEPYDRHRKLIGRYLGDRDGSQQPNGAAGRQPNVGLLTTDDVAALRDGHRFVRTEDDDCSNSWEVRLAKKYYDRLFREYCIVDLSLYKYGCLGMRWRTEAEVVEGKGQFQCGGKGCLKEYHELSSYEVNFVYMEGGDRKQTLVKARLCGECAGKMNYKRERATAAVRKAVNENGKAKKHRDLKKKRKERGREKGGGGAKKKRRGEKNRSNEGEGGGEKMSLDDWMEDCLEGMFE